MLLQVGIVGGTGYTGVELLRLLSQHPDVSLRVITSRQETGRFVAQVFPSLRTHPSLSRLKFSSPDDPLLTECDVVFFATPHGVAMNDAARLLKSNVRIIDLAADFRLSDPAQFERWYKMPHACPDILREAVYGLPELYRNDIKNARVVANPGCYPTAVQLGFYPLLKSGVIDPQTLIADCKSGVSGSGRKGDLGIIFAEVTDNFAAYGITAHRHHPEIEQGLSKMSKESVNLTFTPHLTPMIRGIFATLYANLTQSSINLQTLFEETYAHEPFIDVMPEDALPDTRSVRGSNLVRLAVKKRGKLVTVLAVEDNLVKGASGQAVQNMNVMFGLPETTGLTALPVMP
jgi:N-acetyl-gamma-glutamyl-phosphate reductase